MRHWRGLGVVFALVFGQWALMPPLVRAQAGAYQAAGTRKMAALLEQIYRDEDWKSDPNKDAERVAYWREQLGKTPALRDELKIR
ncbi:MAG: hypothetical protein ABLQ96_08600, partial [Candidatus Acidiferrum sp.]